MGIMSLNFHFQSETGGYEGKCYLPISALRILPFLQLEFPNLMGVWVFFFFFFFFFISLFAQRKCDSRKMVSILNRR